jgi:hypothetical protein
MRALQRHLAKALAEPSAVYHIVVDTTLIPAMVRVRACRKGLFAGQATFGRCRSKTEWVYGFKVALSVSPKGVICAFGLAEAAADERPIGDFLVTHDRHNAYLLADKGFSPRLCGSGTGWRVTGLWSLPRPKTTPAGHGPRPTVAGRRASARSSRGSHRPTQGPLRLRATSGQDAGRSVGPLGRQGRGLHLWAAAQRPARSTAAPLGRPFGLRDYASLVLVLLYLPTYSPWLNPIEMLSGVTSGVR